MAAWPASRDPNAVAMAPPVGVHGGMRSGRASTRCMLWHIGCAEPWAGRRRGDGGRRVPPARAHQARRCGRFEERAKQGRSRIGHGRRAAGGLAAGGGAGAVAGRRAGGCAMPLSPMAGARLEHLPVTAIEDRFEAELRLGRHDEILADLAAVAASHPLRERLSGLRRRALQAAGRQSDALAVFEEGCPELGFRPAAQGDGHARRCPCSPMTGSFRPGLHPDPLQEGHSLRQPDRPAADRGRSPAACAADPTHSTPERGRLHRGRLGRLT
ncbi:BTAD domain-containing putative transcriptional regulator [Nonomuraea sp. NPDC049709]|uniref:BTAD domain-containing putative transcriptional regulator n=1 Tax=Nonomuraea sp. NPDC049709 TaxID=3154736 RepID=UPI00342B20D2